MSLFFELLQVAVGERKCLSHTPTAEEWQELYNMAEKHTVVGVCFSAVKRLECQGQIPPPELYMQWIAMTAIIQQRNEVMNRRCKDLQEQFRREGFLSCILKGQDYTRYYGNLGLLRQSGDIDIWVNYREGILDYARKNYIRINHIDIKNADIEFYQNIKVEVHFRPSWMYNPLKNRKLLKWFSQYPFNRFEEKNGIVVPPIDFSLVYAMVHIYRHFFDEGIGLRQIIDYYFILRASSEEIRERTMATLNGLGLGKAVAGIMWVMGRCLGSELFKKLQLCPSDENVGRFLMDEIMKGGNFGHHDNRNQKIFKSKRWMKGVYVMQRNARFLRYFPAEVISCPIWKFWHYCWRKQKGYL